jgi:Ca2+/Na+ antiporter
LFNRHDLSVYHLVQKSFRDSILFSILVITFLYLLGIGFLRWWNVGILLIGIIFYLIFVWTTNKTPDQIQN